MSKHPILLQNWYKLWWSDPVAPRIDESEEKNYSKHILPHSDRAAQEWHAVDQQYRRIITDLSEGKDDWHRIHHVLPLGTHASATRLITTNMDLRTIPVNQQGRWLRLHRLHLTLLQHSTKAQELLRIVGQLTEFFDDQQLTRIHQYLVRMPKIFRGGDQERTCYILACLNLELERHGYTLLRQQLLNELNQQLDVHVTKRDVKKAQWELLKLDKHLNKARLKERLTTGKNRRRMIFISLLDSILTNTPNLRTFLNTPSSRHRVKSLALHIHDAYQNVNGGWIRNDLELTALACVDLALQLTFQPSSRGNDIKRNNSMSKMNNSFHRLTFKKPRLLEWLPNALHPQHEYLAVLRQKIKKSIWLPWERLMSRNDSSESSTLRSSRCHHNSSPCPEASTTQVNNVDASRMDIADTNHAISPTVEDDDSLQRSDSNIECSTAHEGHRRKKCHCPSNTCHHEAQNTTLPKDQKSHRYQLTHAQYTRTRKTTQLNSQNRSSTREQPLHANKKRNKRRELTIER